MTKIALLISCKLASGEWKYLWDSPQEIALSGFYDTKEEALVNRPAGYKCLNDGWQEI